MSTTSDLTESTAVGNHCRPFVHEKAEGRHVILAHCQLDLSSLVVLPTQQPQHQSQMAVFRQL